MSNTEITDYLQTRIEKEGTFRGFPVSWTVEKYDSGSIAIAFQLAISQEWGGKEGGWSDPWPTGWFIEHRAWVIKKGGTDMNMKAVESLKKCGLWNGDFDAIAGPPPSVFVLLDIGSEEFEGKMKFRADWVNPNADEPQARGGFKPADKGLLANLSARFKPQLKAVGGAPAGAAAAPPAAAPGPAGMAQPAPAPTTAAPAPAAPPATAPPAALAPPTLAPQAAPAAMTPPAAAAPPAATQAAPPSMPGQWTPPASGAAADPVEDMPTPF